MGYEEENVIKSMKEKWLKEKEDLELILNNTIDNYWSEIDEDFCKYTKSIEKYLKNSKHKKFAYNISKWGNLIKDSSNNEFNDKDILNNIALRLSKKYDIKFDLFYLKLGGSYTCPLYNLSNEKYEIYYCSKLKNIKTNDGNIPINKIINYNKFEEYKKYSWFYKLRYEFDASLINNKNKYVILFTL